MTTTADEFIKKAVEHRKNGRINEAIIAARHATTLSPEEANSWWQLALAVSEKDGSGAALAHFKKTTELAPHFAYGWHRLGEAYKKTGLRNEAIDCWEKAIEVDEGSIDTLGALLGAYRERDNADDGDKVFEVMKLIDAQDRLLTEDVNRLGIEYHKRKDYYKSIIYFRRFAAEDASPIGFYNLGLAYNAPEIGQDTDAIDAWRRALGRDATYNKAQSSLDRVLKAQIDLKDTIENYTMPLIGEDQWYVNYINPFELFALEDVDDPLDMDIKAIQKAKKALLQEIDLEDGAVEWMPGLKIDRSSALKVADELNDDENRSWHHLVYRSKGLLEFLSRGKLDHFLVDPDDSPEELLEALENNSDDFAPWLSKKFAPQYNLLLTEAIGRKDIDAIECMLDGRRWVIPEDEDKCFDGAHRQVQSLIQPLRDALNKYDTIKPSEDSVRSILAQGEMGPILTILPMAFQKDQAEAATLIRSISIDAYNKHGDPDLAKNILELARTFATRSPSLRHRIDEDVETLNERIKEERKDEASLTLSGASYSITREGVRFGQQFIPVKEIETIRWGISISRSGTVATYAFSVAVGGRGSTVARLGWSSYKDVESQRGLFNTFIDASMAYVMPTIHEKLLGQLDRGETVQIGPAIVRSTGVLFTIAGWFSSKSELCPWHRLRAELSNGDLLISDSGNHKAKISMTLSDTDNAYILYVLIRNKS